MNKGNIRECFFLNQLLVKHKVHIAKDDGDFLVDEKYTFEVGGANKGFKQVANKKHSYIVVDDLAIGMQDKIPMWLLGFLS